MKDRNTFKTPKDTMKARILPPSATTIATAATPTHPSQTPAIQPTGKELLTQVEMAQRLGISRRTLHNWVCARAVPMIKIRGYCRFDVQKVLAALEQHEQPAALPPAPASGGCSRAPAPVSA
ncbi:MAG: helix-turn-helix domain-containing protein [Verrucomicrobia bacterium]|nr:helix-turn-helix domain-containing protein [Verrucomicrobiota bacterium]